MVIIPKFFQIMGMLLLIEGLYLGIAKHSMNMELICVGIGIAVFYLGRWLEKRKG
ncbi:MAG: hypothetical protein ACE5GU_01120 [Candidatus Scalinduaceae bacterium]